MISLIAAISKNNVIGNKGEIPWMLSSDLKRFATLTKNHTVIMGRKTYESIIARLGKPLPERKNVVITSNPAFQAPCCFIFHSLEDAMSATNADGEVFVIGGEELYRKTLSFADKLYLTEVDVVCDGDAFFPKLDKEKWCLEEEHAVPQDEKNQYASTYFVYTRNT